MFREHVGFGVVALGLTALISGCNAEADFAGQSADKPDPKVIVDQEFTAGTVGEQSLAFDPRFGLVDQAIRMAEKAPVKARLKQAERPVGMDAHRQGHDGATANEPFEVSTAGKLDLLVVVDNSGSMKEEQENLATKLSSLTKHLKKVDWQIAVVTTDNSCLRGGKVIKSTDADAEKAFEAAVNADVNGSGNETGVLQALRGLQGRCSTGNYTWLRPDSAVAVFFITDEENYRVCGILNNCREGAKPSELISYMKGSQLNRSMSKLRAYALLWNENQDPTCKKENGETFGSEYEDILEEFNPGFPYGSICAADYSNVLEQISKDVSRILKKEVELKYPPVDGTLSIMVDGQPFTDFDLDGKTIKFKSLPDDALKATISYQYDPTPKFDRFKLSKKADPSTIEVWVDRKKVDPAKLTYDSTNDEIVFVEMPANDAEIKIKYRDDTALPATFDLSKHPLRGMPLKVKIGGKVETGYAYDETTKVLTFDVPPVDGETVEVWYKEANGRITRYKAVSMNGPDGQDALAGLVGFVVKDPATGEEVPAELVGDKVTFLEDDVVDGREVVATYDFGDSADALRHAITDEPLPGTLKVSRADGSEECISNVRIEDSEVRFDCDDQQLGQVFISYEYVASIATSFKVDGNVPEAHTHWQVFVDGQAVRAFQRDGNTIMLPAEGLSHTSKVRVVVTEDQF